MFAWTSHGTELKRFARQPITRAAIAVLLLIPLLYGAMYVWAFWDPTTHMDKLPVALVNADIASRDDDGTLQHYGDDLVGELLDSRDIGWAQVDEETAVAGMNSGSYYFAVTVPSSFTADINSLAGDDPTAASIEVTYDDSNSFLASTLGKTAMLEVQKAVREKIGTEAVSTLLVGVGDARDGFATASDGAFELSEGLSGAVDGSEKLNVGAGDLARGAAQLAAGTVDLSTGSRQLADSLDDYVAGVSRAGAGVQQLADGADDLAALQAGLAAAADPTTGAPALAAGIGTLADGVTGLADGATRYAAGATSFASGADTWAAGAEKWRQAAYQATGGSLVSGTKALANGNAALAEATSADSSLAKGATALGSASSGLADDLDDLDADHLKAAEKALEDGDAATAAAELAKARTAVKKASAEASAMAGAASSLNGGLDELNTSATTLSGAASALESGWAAIHEGVAEDGQLGKGLSDLDAGQESLGTAAATLTDAAGELSDPATLTKVAQLKAGADGLSSGLTTMSAAADAGIPQLRDGLANLVDGFTNADPEKGLVAGAEAIAAGADTLAEGIDSAVGGADQVSDGATTIADGTPDLVSGLDRAVEGADKLGSKLAEGADQIPDDSAGVRQTRADAVAVPVSVSSDHVWEAESWGEGFAPFFIPLALWVGALISWLLLRPLQTRALMTSVSGFRMAWGSLNSALLLALGQVSIMLAVMHVAIGLNPKNVAATFLFSLLAAAAFFALQQFFQVTLGSAVGKVVIIVLLMVQLASAGGTYPLQTTPAFLQMISPFMPMTYVVNGLREAITGGMEARFWTSTVVLTAIFVLSLAATSVASARKRMWTMARLHPALSI